MMRSLPVEPAGSASPVPPALSDAIIDVCWRAVPHGTNAIGDIEDYLITAGAMHRLIGAAQGAGVHAAFRAPGTETTINSAAGSASPVRHDEHTTAVIEAAKAWAFCDPRDTLALTAAVDRLIAAVDRLIAAETEPDQ